MTGKHAIAVGGSIGGLLAAHVLCDRFERVTLIERDVLPTGAEPRSDSSVHGKSASKSGSNT